ncbi:MAG: hypothetical protein HZB23_14955 [Deltaproteobacteria bacterium]|nr:hypothetical protein [Deltaproteobacteria bacterium]
MFCLPPELLEAEISIPLYQVAALLLATTLTLLAGRLKLSLIINYLFTLYWGYIANSNMLLGEGVERFSTFTMFYLGFGFVIAILAAFAFLLHSNYRG